MIRRLTLLFAAAALAVLFIPATRAGQDEGNWEFHLFGAKASLDNEDPLAREKPFSGDLDGTAVSGTFRRSTTLDDNLYAGFRLGYIWNPNVETEVCYDRNHTSGDYEHSIGGIEEVHGRISAVLTTYQFGGLYHPLGKWRTPWQPYATLSAGYIDVNFSPSKSIESRVKGGLAGSLVDFPSGDHNWLVGYGVGLKYYLRDNVAVRAEIRGKMYELFSERRNDREISLGLSFFAPGATF